MTRDVTECEHSQLKDCSNDEEGTTRDESKQEATIASPIDQNERMMDTKKTWHITMPFDHLRRHVCHVSKNEWDGNVLWKFRSTWQHVWQKLNFVVTQQKD